MGACAGSPHEEEAIVIINKTKQSDVLMSCNDDPYNHHDAQNMIKLNEFVTKLQASEATKQEINSKYLLDSSSMSGDSNCDLDDCQCLERICCVLNRYAVYINNIHNDNDINGTNDDVKYNDIYNESYNNIKLLNDFNHLLMVHSNQFEHIYDILVEQSHNKNVCDLLKCTMMRRNQRDRAKITKNEDLMKNMYANSDNIVMEQLLDKIHCNYFHTFDIGYKLTRKNRQNIMNEETKGDDDEIGIDDDVIVSRINESIISKRDSYKNINGLERLKCTGEKNKFMMEQKTTDFEMNTFSYGYRYFYWDYYKDNESIHDDAHQDASTKLKWMTNIVPISNHNSTVGDWYINKKYDNFKDELLRNGIECIAKTQWETLLQKAEIYIKLDIVRDTKCSRTISASYYELKHEQSMTINHLIAMMIYCNFDILQRRFTETFRRLNEDETNEAMKKRHRNYYFLGKLLRECVECFGMKDPHSAAEWKDLPLRTQEISVYQGVNKQFKYSSMRAHIKCPLSTTRDYTVAVNFCANKGVIVNISAGISGFRLQKKDEIPYPRTGFKFRMSCLDMSWISDFSNEQEIFFIGGLNEFVFNTIIHAPLGKNYQKYIGCIGNIMADWSMVGNSITSDEEYVILYRLLSHEINRHYPNNPNVHEFKSCPEYVRDLLHLHCENVTLFVFVKPITDNSKWQKIHNMMFKYDNGWIKLELIMTVFPNMLDIVFEPDHVTFLQKSVVYKSVLSFLNNNYKTTMLQRIKINLGNIVKSQDDKYLSQVQLHQKEFDKYGWRIDAEVIEDLYGMGDDCPMPPIRNVTIIIQSATDQNKIICIV